MKKYRKISVIISSFVLSLTTVITINSCNSDLPTTSPLAYYREGQLRNVFRNEILPLHKTFQTALNKLSDETTNFKNQPSDDNLELVKAQWKVTISAWRKCELYNFGPVRDKFLHNRIGSWPIDADRLEEKLAEAGTIDADFIASQGSNIVGLASMEYLLFDTTYTLSEVNRLTYLTSTIESALKVTEEIISEWDNYQAEFESQLGGDLDGSQTKMVNALISHLEVLVNNKVGRPLGKVNGFVNSEDVEAFRSEYSLEIIKSNLITVKRNFTGKFAPTAFNIGFQDFLIESNAEDLANNILNQIKLCQTNAENINEPLHEAIINQPWAVEALYHELIQLLVLFKVDMPNVLGSTITFTDNDGD